MSSADHDPVGRDKIRSGNSERPRMPKLHRHLAVLAPLFPEGVSTCAARHLRNLDEERKPDPFATR